MKKTLLLLITIILWGNAFSQDTSIVKFFPLKIGNVWVYNVSGFNPNPPCGCSEKVKVKAIDTLRRNGHLYFLFQSNIIGGGNCCCPPPFDTLRVDSFNCNVYKYTINNGCTYSPHDITIDSLKARLNDHVKISCGSDTAYKCIDTNSYNVLGTVRQSRKYQASYFEGTLSRSYTKGIGLSGTFNQGTWGSCTSTLLGCVIGGIVIGDTTFITGINYLSTDIPKEFKLYQNYPNPFNPTTKIKFAIPLSRGVPAGWGVSTKLIIYDILGREVETLVNERLSPGTYEVEWDGSNYASGVYYYKLTATEYTETKKLILLK